MKILIFTLMFFSLVCFGQGVKQNIYTTNSSAAADAHVIAIAGGGVGSALTNTQTGVTLGGTFTGSVTISDGLNLNLGVGSQIKDGSNNAGATFIMNSGVAPDGTGGTFDITDDYYNLNLFTLANGYTTFRSPFNFDILMQGPFPFYVGLGNGLGNCAMQWDYGNFQLLNTNQILTWTNGDLVNSGNITALGFIGIGTGLTALNASKITSGIIPVANSQTNLLATLYNDTNANWFLNSASVSDEFMRGRMRIAVNDLRTYGLWAGLTNGGDLMFFDTALNPTNHLTFLGNRFSVTNETYVPEGFGPLRYTNQVVMTLPSQITSNFTFFVFYRENADGFEKADGTGQALQQLAGISSSAFDEVALDEFYSFRGSQIWTANKGVFVSSNNAYITSNRISAPLSGSFRSDESVAPTIPTLYIVTGTTNGNVTVYVNGRMGQFESPATNALTMTNISNPFSVFRIGGGDSRWNLINNNSVQATNAYGVTILSAGVFNQYCDSNSAAGIMRLVTDLTHKKKAVEIAGSSILNNRKIGYSGGGVPTTNSIEYLYDKMYGADTLVIQSAAPGSLMANWSSQSGGWSNNIPYAPVISLLNEAAFPIREFVTDGYRNDAIAGALPVTCSGLMATNTLPLSTNGIQITDIVTTWAYNASAANNLNFIAASACVQTNLPWVTMRWANVWFSSNQIAAASQDIPPVHLDALSIVGKEASQLLISIMRGSPMVPFGWWNGCIIASGGNALPNQYTNQPSGMTNFPFKVLDVNDGHEYGTFDASGLTNLPYAKTLTSTNGVWTPTVNANGSTNWAFVVTNLPAAQITGTLPAISGASLTGLNASQVTSGTLPAAQLPYVAQGATAALTNLSNGNGAALTGIPLTGLTTVPLTNNTTGGQLTNFVFIGTTNYTTAQGNSVSNSWNFGGTNFSMTLSGTNGSAQPIVYSGSNNSVAFFGNGAGATNLNAANIASGTTGGTNNWGNLVITNQGIFRFTDSGVASGYSINFNGVTQVIGGNISPNCKADFRNAALTAWTTISTEPNGKFNGNGAGVTNLTSSIQAGQTNVTLVGATTMTVYLKTAMPGTNWIPTLTENGGLIPGFSVTGVTTTNFTTSMTALTFTGNLWWTGIMETQ